MKYTEVMSELKKLGTAQNRKVYARHGAGPKMFGVSFANLYKVQKKCGVDQKLADQLWKSKNSDAQTLALLIADPEKIKISQLDKWVNEITYYMLGYYIGALLAKTKKPVPTMEKWMKSKNEFVSATGWGTLSTLLRDGVAVSDAKCKSYLKTIEQNIHKAPNRTKHEMNGALIAIGSYKPDLTNLAIDVAKRIGKVKVDHGQTSCKTPDAIPYIKKVVARLKKKGKAGRVKRC